MKTAMQEAIEYLKSFNLEASAIILEDKFLEMEKKQHETTFHRGINIGALNPELDIEGRKESAKHYYETTFDKVDNQKELIIVDFDKVKEEWIKEANGMTELEKVKYYFKKIKDNQNK